MPITQFEGKALVFNNGVVDVQQNGVSVVDSEKIAHIISGSGDGVSEGRVNEMIDIKLEESDMATKSYVRAKAGDAQQAAEMYTDTQLEGYVSEGEFQHEMNHMYLEFAVTTASPGVGPDVWQMSNNVHQYDFLHNNPIYFKWPSYLSNFENDTHFTSEGDLNRAIGALNILSEGDVNDLIDLKVADLDYISEGDLNDALSNLDFASEGDIEQAISSLDILSEGDVNNLIDLKVADLDFVSEGDLNEAISDLDLLSEGDVNNLIDIKINELDYASEGDISAAIAELDIPEYSAGDHISISSAGVISATGIPTFTYDPTTQSLEITL